MVPKNRSIFGANIPYAEKTVLLLQNSKTQSVHQFQFLHWILHCIRMIFFVYSEIAFFGSISSDIYSMKFCHISWRMNFSIFNKGEQFFFFWLYRSSIPIEWNYNACNSQVIRLSIQVPRFKSQYGANILLLEKMVFSLSNLRQQRLLNFSFNLIFLLREG